MTSYRVNLDMFAGPLDLLLYLVRKEEVEIYDIPIAHITAQYIKYIEMLKMLDIDLAGDFIVMAATLMEIKSFMLLPAADTDDQDEQDIGDPRAELIRQLLEYKKFKDASNLLKDSAEQRQERFTRPDSIIAGLKDNTEPEVDLDEISIWTLLDAFDKIMQATSRYLSYDHIKDDTPIDLYQIEILHRLQTDGPMTFETIFQGKSNRLIMVGLFLAMLELIRSHLIWIEQPDALGPIYLRSLTEVPAAEAVQNAIYAIAETDETRPANASETSAASTAENAVSGDTGPSDLDETGFAPPEDTKQLPIAIRELPPKKDTAPDHNDEINDHHSATAVEYEEVRSKDSGAGSKN